MPTIFEARMDGSESIRYFHVHMIGFYLSAACDYANSLSKTEDLTLRLRNTISTITYSAMALEAFINELSETEVSKKFRDEFDRGQKTYKKPQGQSLLRFKFCRLLLDKYQHEASAELVDRLEFLANLRNTLVHYKLSETAGKYIMDPPTTTLLSGGRKIISLDFSKAPRRVEPPFLEKISPEVGLKSYQVVLDTIKLWLELEKNFEQLELLGSMSSSHSYQQT